MKQKTISIKLAVPELKLLLHYLKAHAEARADEGCNDMFDDELREIGLSKAEWKTILPQIEGPGMDEPAKDPEDLFTPDPIYFVLNRIKEQIPKGIKHK